MDILITYSKEIGLVFFFSIFMMILLWVFNPKTGKDLEAHKYLPLAENEHE